MGYSLWGVLSVVSCKAAYMQLFVRDLTGRTAAVEADALTDVASLKDRLITKMCIYIYMYQKCTKNILQMYQTVYIYMLILLRTVLVL